MKNNAREAVRSLARARLRTALALIGIVIGIGSVITLISLGEIARATARAEFEALGTDILTVRKQHSRSARNIKLGDVVALSDSVASVREVAPRVSYQADFNFAGRRVGSGPVHGVTASYYGINKLELEEGRFVSDLDVDRFFCVVGAELAGAMRRLTGGPVVGETLKADDRVFTVAGILHPNEEVYSLPFSQETDTAIFVPITTAERLESRSGIELIVIRAAPDVDHEVATQQVDSWLRDRIPKLRVEVLSAKQLIAQMESQLQLMTLLLGAIGSVSLIVGGIGIMNVMLVSVAERRREIGIRRALGARRRDIQNQFLVECVILSLVGGVLGIVVGSATTWGICNFTDWEFFVSTMAVGSGLVASTVIGILFGIQPAFQAARMDPIEALQA